MLGLLALLLIMPSTKHASAQSDELTLQKVWASPSFYAQRIRGVNPMNDGTCYSSLDFDRESKATIIKKISFSDGESIGDILNSSDLKNGDEEFAFDGYEFSPDESMVLLETESEAIYRYSSKANWFIYNLDTKKLKAISENGKQMYPTFSPDGSMIAFMRDNDLVIVDLLNMEEKQITSDGELNKIINGATDWVYEEEFAYTRAFHWSGDSKKILYQKFDESEVPEFIMPIYDGLYPTMYTFKYPKAGEKNSVLSMHMYDLASGKTSDLNLGNDPEQYFPRSGWTQDPNTCWVQWMNRNQNETKLILVDATTGESKTILEEKNKYYIDVYDNLTFLKSRRQFIWTSEKSGFTHLYLHDISGAEVNAITLGDWDIDEFHGVNEKNGTVYYSSAEESPIARHIYSVKLNGKGKKKLSSEDGNNEAIFSSDFSHFINIHSDANNPYTVSLRNAKGKNLKVVQENEKVRKEIEDLGFTTKEFFTFKTSQGTELNGYMIRPHDFDPYKKYPLLMWVYGGPGSQQVKDAWGGLNFAWFQYLASQGYMVACVDNRGTGARGEEFKKMTYMQLGKYETVDQIEAAKFLGKLGYIDENRIGIMGWSYGGYMSSLCLTKGADVFKTAVAVAPVINWRYYDTIYTERFMRTPQENPDGYDLNSPINFVEKLRGNYLLIHGTADDNVHYQNSMAMVKEMVKQNKKFDFESYVDKNHGIYGGYTRLQLFTKVSEYLMENL